MKWTHTAAAALAAALAAVLLAALLLATSATPAEAAPPPPQKRATLRACTPYEREHWMIVDENTQVEGRTIYVHTSPDGSRRCGEVRVSTARPQAPRKVRR